MREYGYQWNEMLPLTQEKALELFGHDLHVYLLHTDGTESLAESRERIEEHEGIFGVEKETWNKALKQQEKMPVFVINGFLEAGKTQFITNTLQQDYFQADGTTVLILCEEGDTEYDKEILKKTRTKIVTVEDISEMDEDFYGRIEALYDPARVLIEWNGMWPQDQLQLPDTWELFQQITIIDGSTFDLYLNNMKPLLALLVKHSELVIMNRCDEVSDENITRYRRGLKALNPQAELIFEDAEGEIEQEVLEEDLPYDMKADVIKIDPKDFGIWYIDALDKKDRYEGKVVEFTGMVLKSPEFPKNYFVPGRMAMTCCEADMTFLGFVCKAREARNLENRQWVKVRAKIEYEEWQDYGGVGPVLYAESVEPAEPIKDIVQF